MNRYQAHVFHAERRLVMEQLRAQEPADGRLYGKCEQCGTYHRFPDISYRCECGYRRCSRGVEERGTTCLECGGTMRMEDTTNRGTDGTRAR